MSKPANGKMQFLYRLSLVPRLVDDENWTDEDNAAVGRHFKRLQDLLKEGKLVLAGRTQVRDPMGIVILEVGSEEEAHALMESDPAVVGGVMTAELFPYRVALMRQG
jgi:uncharacterized protein YciI